MSENQFASQTNEEFVDYLYSKLEDRSWLLKDIVELEKRGYEILSGRPDLEKVLTDDRDRSQAALNKIMGPALDSIKKLQGLSLKIPNISSSFPPRISTMSFDPELLERVRLNTPEAKMVELATQQHEVLTAIAEGIDSLASSTLKIRQQRWMYRSTLIAAGTGLVGILIQFFVR